MEVAAGEIFGGVDGVEAESILRGDFLGDLADGLVGFWMLRQSDERAAGTEDAGLFARDVGDGGAEVLLVVERDVGDDGEERVNNVGGVETAAEADLEDGDVDRVCEGAVRLRVGEVEEGECGEGLKV